jgi:hypothetical protein
MLTFENRDIRICTPCVHKICRGWKVKIVCKCETCGHLACEKCLAGGDDAGAKCCMGGEGHHEVGETGEDNKGSHPEYKIPAVRDEGISEAQNEQLDLHQSLQHYESLWRRYGLQKFRKAGESCYHPQSNIKRSCVTSH